MQFPYLIFGIIIFLELPYTKIRQVVQVLTLVRRGKQSVEILMNRVNELQDRLAQVEQEFHL